MSSAWFVVLSLLLVNAYFTLSAKIEMKVTTILVEPFAQYRTKTSLPPDLEGYVIDLLYEIKNRTDFVFSWKPVEDGKYGHEVQTDDWDGMIGELKEDKADLAVGPLTKNDDRVNNAKVKFIDPAFMNFDMAFVMKKRHKTSDIRNLKDLGRQDKVKYTYVKDGATALYFQKSTAYSSIHRSVPTANQVSSVKDGLRKVRESTDNEPWAFIGEQYMLEYAASREPCDLVVVVDPEVKNEEAFKGSYHLVGKPSMSSAHIDMLSDIVKQLKDNPPYPLKALYDKWWKPQCGSASSAAISVMAILTSVIFAILLHAF